MKLRVGIDVGGTFTDIVVYDDEERRVARIFKIPTDAERLVENLVASVRSVLPENLETSEVTVLHGTTVGLNTLLQERGARMALITTRGFRDVYELGRQWRGHQVYNLFARPPKPLVPRHRIIELNERVDSAGSTVTPLEEAEIDRVVAAVRDLDVEAVAVCLLFSFLNPRHEQQLGAALRERLPHITVSLSSEVAPEFREYERTSTVAIDAYVKPMVSRYLSRLERRVTDLGENTRTYIMRSGGGLATVQEAGRLPVQSMFSGPVAGVMGACHLGQAIGWPAVITLDMGGTSTDMALVLDGRPILNKDREIAGRPLNVPTVEVNSIGSGGGSLADVFAGKVIRVGPESAGAIPGPVCYGRGGTRPTLTDAWAVLRHLPDALLDGELPLDRAAALEAIDRTLAKPLGLSVIQAAQSVVQIAVSQSYELMRLITIERGFNPADFNLVTFGGAGPVYAAAVARDLGVPRVCIPRYPGLFSAFGFLTTDLVQDYAETRIARIDSVKPSEIDAIWRRLEQKALAPRPEAQVQRSVDLRYSGQAYEVMVPAPSGEWTSEFTECLAGDFHHAHEKRYGLKAEGEPIEFVVFRVRSFVSFPKPELELSEVQSRRKAIPAAERGMFFEGKESPRVPLYRRRELKPGDVGDGPAVIEEFDTTAVVYPGQSFEIDRFGNIIIITS